VRKGITDLGRFQLGDWVPIVFRTTDSSGVLTAPTTTSDHAPIGAVYLGSTTKVEKFKLNIIDPVVSPATFTYRIRLSSSYSVGRYSIAILFTTGSGAYTGRKLFSFEVVGGGNTNGAITSGHSFERPEAYHYVHAVDSGQILEGRNGY
jgi:hypothetical protein